MRQRIENTLSISVEGVDLTTVSNIEFYVKQNGVFFEYSPVVTDASTMLVTITKEDADRLSTSGVSLQFAYTDSAGKPYASEILKISVAELLKREGYDANQDAGE